MPQITARFHWTADDLLTGRRYAMRLRRWRFVFRIAIIIILLAFAFKINLRETQPFEMLLVIGNSAVIFTSVLFIGKRIGNLIVRRQFNKRPDADMEIEWVISEQCIHTSSPSSTSNIQWKAFQTVISTPKGFLFMPNKQIFHFLPKRAFSNPEDIETVNLLARQYATDFKVL